MISKAQIKSRLINKNEVITSRTTEPYQSRAEYTMSRNDYDAKMLHFNENLFNSPEAYELSCSGGLYRYPENGDMMLRTAAAKVFNLKEDQVFPSAGASHALCILILRFAPEYKKVILSSPSWHYYKICAQSLDVEIIDVPLQVDENSYAYNVKALDNTMQEEGPALLILATPNNPTGNTISYDSIGMLAENHPKSILIVDEAYFGFSKTDHEKAANLLQSHNNVVIVRSLSKAYGLAGLRVGFALASGVVRDAIAPNFLPFGLPELVQRIAAERLNDQDYLKSMRLAYTKGKDALIAALSGTPDFTVYQSNANFCLVQTPEGKASLLANRLEDNGYIVKRQSDSQLRITIAQASVMRDVAKILIGAQQ